MPLYERQQLLEGLKIPETASVVGCGGTGFWTAIFLAMSGVENLILVDGDKVEESNLNRLFVSKYCIGEYKTFTVHHLIEYARPNCRVEEHHRMLVIPKNCAILRGTIFCCTDNAKSQQLVCAYARKNKLPYQRVGYDGTVLNVSRGFPLSFIDIKDVPNGYDVTPSWVIPAVTAAALAVFSQCMSEITITEDMSKLHITDSTTIPEALQEKLRQEGRQQIINLSSQQIINLSMRRILDK